MEPVEPDVSRAKLEALLLHGERNVLDYKASCDITQTAELVELVKDIGAMQVRGGYIVIGVDDRDGLHRVTGIDPGLARQFDEARLRGKVLKYLPETLELLVGHHEVDGKRVVLLYIGAHPDGFAAFIADGNCPRSDGKGTKAVFQADDVFWRDGTQSVKMNPNKLMGLVRQSAARTRDVAGEHVPPSTRGESLSVVLARGPRAVAEAVRGGDRDASAEALDKLVCVLARELAAGSAEDVLGQCVRALAAAYNVPGSDEQHWLRVVERVLALGGLATRLERWMVVRALAIQPVTIQHTEVYANWVRHADVMGSRAGLIGRSPGPGDDLIENANAHTKRLPELRPDGLGEHDDFVASICQFSLYAALAAVDAAGQVDRNAFYPHYAAYRGHAGVAADRVVMDPSVRHALFLGDDDALADALHLLWHYGHKHDEGRHWGHWDGFGEGRAWRWMQEHPPSDEALAHMRW